MKASWKKLLAVSATGLLLAACNNASSGNGSSSSSSQAAADLPEGTKLETEYKANYGLDPTTLDYLFNNQNTTTDHAVNFIDGLYETDQNGNYIPAVATDYKVSDDGLTYTYTIRKGVKWVDVDGNEYAEVKAQDFVTGLKHAVEVKSLTLPIVQDSIKNLDAYIEGKVSDFEEVGVKALDDYTLQYTLEQPEPYFNTKTTYNILYPVNEEFLKSKGKDFGSLSPDSILYNGPFRLSNLTAKSKIEYVKNDQYWDKDNVFIDKVSLTFNDGSDLEAPFRMFKDGQLVAFSVNPNLPIFDEVKSTYADALNVSVSRPGTYYGQFNYNRRSYEHTEKKTDAQKEATKKAILNKHFRQAILFALDRHTYLAQSVGKDYADGRIRNTLVPGNFVSLDGKAYGDVVQEKLQALDADMFGGVDLADGHDAYYNADKAKKAFEEAKKELGDIEYPVRLDLPVDETNETSVNQMKSFKKSVEDSLGKENVIIDVNLLSHDNYWNATFNATTPDAVDYDISTASGWLPDYQDPSTYLAVLNPENGELMVSLGLESGLDKDKEAKEAAGFFKYNEDYQKAVNEKLDPAKRYEAFAAAEATMLDNVLVIPIQLQGATPFVTKAVPFSGPFAFAGPTDGRLKFVKIQDKPVTIEQFKAAKEAWLAAQEKARKEAAEAESKAKEEKKEDKDKESSKESSEEEKASESSESKK